MADFFNDTWDISMSTLLEEFGDKPTASTPATESVNSKTQSFFGLPSHVKLLIAKYKGIESLYDWQIECLSLPAIKKRENLVYSLPTSGGKTLVAEVLMLRELLIEKKNVIFVLPYVALAQEKVRSLAPFGLDLEFYVEEYAGGKGRYPPLKHRKKRSVYVCTIEKAAGLVESLQQAQRLDEVGAMVVDEIHLIGDTSRGPTLEIMLAKLMYVTKNLQIIAMSATIGNLNEIGRFLNAFVYAHDFRPVELTEYIKCGDNIYKIIRSKDDIIDMPFVRKLKYSYSNELRRLDPGLLGGMVQEVIPYDSCLVFCSTKNQCCNFAMLICKTVDRNFKDIKKEEKLSLLRALKEEGQGIVCPVLKKTIPYGVAYHHSGLTNAERKLLEEAFISGTISCICCTSTLAAGVNLPAKRVIIFSPYLGKDFLKLSSYKQMSGRAGRMGLTNTGESILVCEEIDKPKVLDLLKSSMDRCESKLNDSHFTRLIMGAIGLEIATTKSNLIRLISHSLFGIQTIIANDSFTNKSCLEQVVEKSLDELIQSKAIRKCLGEDNFVLTTLAKAALAGNLNIHEAQLVYDDLKEAAENGLLLSNYLHLFYLVTPFSALDEVKINRETVISVYSDLTSVEKKVAERLGITELCLLQFEKYGKVNAISESIWNRFLLSLIIYDLWYTNDVWKVSRKFEVSRGIIHSFLMRTAAFASSVQRFTEALKFEEFECFPILLQPIIPRISYCCSAELLQLMQLPSVKIGRAKQLYQAGYKTVKDLISAEPLDLVKSVDHLPRRVAYEIVAAAKLLMIERAETLQEEADVIKADMLPVDILDVPSRSNRRLNLSITQITPKRMRQ